MPSALDDLRILDLADVSGAYCGKLLADMGADVIRIEPPGGDPMRRIGPFFGGSVDPERSLFFWHYNASKRSITLDLDLAHGKTCFLDLLREADAVVDTGALAAHGLTGADLACAAPRAVIASITPFGQGGPYAGWRSSDTVAQAMGGMVFVNGHGDEPPLRGFGLQAYHSASMHAAAAILLALLRRERTGLGQCLDVSLQSSAAAAVEHVSGLFHQSGIVEERRGGLHWSRYFRVGRARDGFVLHSLLGDWEALAAWLEADGRAQDLGRPEYASFDFRRAHCEHVFDVLDEWAATYDVADLVEGAQLRRIPYAPILPLAALPGDEHLRQRGFFVDVEHEGIGTVRYPGAPYRFSATPWRIRRPPRLGEHDKEISPRSQVPGPRSGMRGEAARTNPRPGTWDLGPGTKSPILSGLRVIDFTWVVAGPVATRLLADHGAEVVKIERRDAADFGMRRGGLTGNLNRGKKSIVLDMNRESDRVLVRELIATADVVVDNFSSRVMPNWGLDYASLRQLNPRLIAVSMSGFGRTGPSRDRVSYGPTLQALAGATAAMRHPGGAPAGWGFSFSDMAAGYHAALAVLMALWHRRQSGEGQCIDLAQFESLAALSGPPLLAVLNGGGAAVAAGNRSPEAPAAPHGVYRCTDRDGNGNGTRRRRDRWCAITVFGDEDWRRFVRAIGTPRWSTAERFATMAARLAHESELDGLVGSWTRTRSAEDVMHTLQHAGVAAGIVADAEDLCLRDPQLRSRGHWVDVDTPEGRQVRLDGIPFLLGDGAATITSPGPLLGEQQNGQWTLGNEK